MSKTRIVSLFGVLLATVGVTGTELMTLEGTVINGVSRAPLRGVTVEVVGLQLLAVSTGDNGRYRIEGLADGPLEVHYTLNHYLDKPTKERGERPSSIPKVVELFPNELDPSDILALGQRLSSGDPGGLEAHWVRFTSVGLRTSDKARVADVISSLSSVESGGSLELYAQQSPTEIEEFEHSWEDALRTDRPTSRAIDELPLSITADVLGRCFRDPTQSEGDRRRCAIKIEQEFGNRYLTAAKAKGGLSP